jgi:hypothetical protein
MNKIIAIISRLKQCVMKRNILAIFAILLLVSCRKEPDFSELSSQFLVGTNLDQQADFSSYKTYYISDTVLLVGGEKDDSTLSAELAQQLLKVVKDSMGARGYVFAPRGDANNHPDLGLTLSVVKNITVVIQSYPGWWGGYYGGCYWYYCYPYYYPWTSIYSYTTGTVLLNMYDIKNATKDEEVKAIWNVTGLGALGSAATTNIQLGAEALQQGFAQSPYVRTH